MILRRQGVRCSFLCEVIKLRIDADFLNMHCGGYFNIIVEQEVTSTNDIVKSLANNGAAHGTVMIAQSQTAGRGRMTRSFFSPKDSGVYMSILLRPDIPIKDSVRITTCAAVAVKRAIEKFIEEPVYIKWVNDLYMRDKKVCGILTEASVDADADRLKYAVLGIGLNVDTPLDAFPDDIKGIAGSVFSINVSDEIMNRLVLEVLNEIKTGVEDIYDKKIEDEYKNSSWLDGKYVDVMIGNDTYPAKVIGVADDFQLEIETESGKRQMISFGEVSVKVK